MTHKQADADIDHLITLLGQTFPAKTPRLVQLPTDQPIVFIGDIHGDSNAVETVFSEFSPANHVLVFMGDVVDRGLESGRALTRIAQEKLNAPSNVHLLMGNHEARSVSTFRPAEFWESLRINQVERLAHHLEKLPWSAWHPAGILATHGAIPELSSLAEINKIALGDTAWRAITWGDWVDKDSEQTGEGKRPSFGPTAFETRTAQLGVIVHIRSHQPTCPLYSFSDRCLTLFTSSAYGDGKRRVALWKPGQPVNSAHDLELIEI